MGWKSSTIYSSSRGMYESAKNIGKLFIKFRLAKRFRQEMTPSETIPWAKHGGNQLMGLHFRRQHVIRGFIPLSRDEDSPQLAPLSTYKSIEESGACRARSWGLLSVMPRDHSLSTFIAILPGLRLRLTGVFIDRRSNRMQFGMIF